MCGEGILLVSIVVWLQKSTPETKRHRAVPTKDVNVDVLILRSHGVPSTGNTRGAWGRVSGAFLLLSNLHVTGQAP